MTDTHIPPQAITAAAEAIEHKLMTDPPPEYMTWLDADEELARAALEAAAPHLAAAERERCAQLAERHHAHAGCYVRLVTDTADIVTSGLRPFADLLREQP